MRSSGRQKGAISRGTLPANPLRRAGWLEVIQWWIGRRIRVRVSGRSMSPTLEPGQDVLVRKTQLVEVGDVVVARHPFRSETLLIKRVHEQRSDGRLDLRGDAAEASSDSRTLGLFDPSRLVGRVTCRL